VISRLIGLLLIDGLRGGQVTGDETFSAAPSWHELHV